MFKAIVCTNLNGSIGNCGKLMYTIKNDIHNFKTITDNSVVVMGRKTFESIPNPPLKNRINIILTRDESYSVDASIDNVLIAHSIEDVVDICSTLYIDKEWFVIGGASIYNEFNSLDLIDTIFLTTVFDDAEGDTKFFNIDKELWTEFYASANQSEDGSPTFQFTILTKKKNV